MAGSRLTWWEEWTCESCGALSSSDGPGSLPDELRAHVLAVEGSFTVNVTPMSSAATISFLLRNFGLSLQQAKSAHDLLPGPFRTSLTRAEARCLANTFPPDVAEARVEPDDPSLGRMGDE